MSEDTCVPHPVSYFSPLEKETFAMIFSTFLASSTRSRAFLYLYRPQPSRVPAEDVQYNHNQRLMYWELLIQGHSLILAQERQRQVADVLLNTERCCS